MSEIFPETSPSPFGPDGQSAATVEEARRGWALELATQLHAARERAGKPSVHDASLLASEVTQTAEVFANYLRGGGNG